MLCVQADIKRKLPYYKSDFTDALNLQSIATFCFMYFALLAPIVTFGGLLEVCFRWSPLNWRF